MGKLFLKERDNYIRLLSIYTIFCIMIVAFSLTNTMMPKYLLIIILICFFMKSNIHNKTYELLLLLPYINLIIISHLSFSVYTILTVIYLLHNIILLKRVDKYLVLLFLGLILIQAYNINKMGLNSYIAWLINIIFLFIIFNNYYINIKFNRVLFSFIYGVFLSSILGFLVRVMMPDAPLYIKNYSAVQGERSLATLRFSGLMYDPNYYAQGCLLAIALIFILFKFNAFNKISKLFLCFMLLTITIFGLYSHSKMFIITLAFTLLIVLVDYLKTNKINILKMFITTIIGVPVIYIIINTNVFNTYLNNMHDRFIDLSTGRLSIIKHVIDLGFNDLELLIFGQGIGKSMMNYFDTALHNIFLETFFSYGLIGFFIYTIFIVYGLFRSEVIFNKRYSLALFLPILVLVFTGLTLDGIWADWHYLYLLIICSIYNFIDKSSGKEYRSE